MKKVDLNTISVDEKVLAKAGANFRGRVVRDKGDTVEIKIEREPGTVPLVAGGQCMVVVLNMGDKLEALTATLINVLTRSVKMPNNEGQPTRQIGIPEMGRYQSVIKAIKAHNQGVLEFENDEDFKYLRGRFNQVQIPADPQSSEIIVDLAKALDRADVKEQSGGSSKS